MKVIKVRPVRDRVRQIADHVVDEHPEAMQILANHDPERDPRLA